jgi:hypothetical protein
MMVKYRGDHAAGISTAHLTPRELLIAELAREQMDNHAIAAQLAALAEAGFSEAAPDDVLNMPEGALSVPPTLYHAADSAAASFGSTARSEVMKVLRDVVKRGASADGRKYGTCSRCHGLVVQTDTSDPDLRCLECGAG